jgi:hypothetical protein
MTRGLPRCLLTVSAMLGFWWSAALAGDAPPKAAPAGAVAPAPKTAPAEVGVGSLEALLQSIPAGLMPRGAMTDAQRKALEEWAQQRLAGAPLTVDVTLVSVEGDGENVVVTAAVGAPVKIHDRSVRCTVRATFGKGAPEGSRAGLKPGRQVTLTGKVAPRDPLTPITGTVEAGKVRMQVAGWSAMYACFLMNLEACRWPDPPPPPKPAEFFGAKAEGVKIVYIIDRSGSMTDSMEYVKFELKRSIGNLDEARQFHVLFYSSGPPLEMPPRKLLDASAANKQLAYGFIDGVIAQGETDPSKALERAFECNPDAIYLLTDGEFDRSIAALVKRLNAAGTVKVHTLGFLYRTGEAVLKEIAAQNGGQHRFVSEADLPKLPK